MGELVNLEEYRAWKSKQDEEKKQTEKVTFEVGTLEELEALRDVLEEITKDLPDVEPSIMCVPIEPNTDAFMGKDDFDMSADLDGYLTKLGLRYSEDDDREDT